MTTPETRKYKIAAIPGDGIGREVVPEGLRAIEAAGRRFGFSAAFAEFRLELRSVSEDRANDARGWAGAASPVRRDFSGRGGISRRSRPYFAVGPADSDTARTFGST